MTTQLQARTLEEAYLFVDLVVGAGDPAELRRLTELLPAGGSQVLRVHGRYDGELHDFAVLVPDEDREDVRLGELYGEDRTPSTLIDAGQWRVVEEDATVHIGRLLEEAGGGGLSAAALDELGDHLETAYSALVEIGKFLPDGAAEVPAAAFWSELGRLIRANQPEAFRRDRLARDEAEYRSMADRIIAFRAGG